MSARNNTFAVAVIGRDGKCKICGTSEQLQAHHIVPISKGGMDVPENGIALCADCHADQHPNVPRELFLIQVEGEAQKGMWNATTLAAKFGCCQRTITRAAKAIQLTMYGSRWTFFDEEAEEIYRHIRLGKSELKAAKKQKRIKKKRKRRKMIQVSKETWIKLKKLQKEAIKDGLPSTMSDIIERSLQALEILSDLAEFANLCREYPNEPALALLERAEAAIGKE